MLTIPLTRGLVALVDDQDAHLAKLSWYAKPARNGRMYAAHTTPHDANGKQRQLVLHREVLGVSTKVDVDHKNNNGLDCRRENLRVATKSQNCWNRGKHRNNTSGFKGVYKAGRKWRAMVRVAGKLKHVGLFNTPGEAARAYDDAAVKLHGEFARLNGE